MIEATPFLPGLSPIGGKEITATFDGGQLSSDGGVLILREIEKRLGLARTLSRHVPDTRDPDRIVHTHDDMIRARVFAIANGYEDCDDLDGLRIDPAFKMACGRKPGTGADLMSQPTLSRLENAPSWRALARMALGMIDTFCASFTRVPGRIVLDIDDTDDPAHGQQELIFFNTHSGGYCFQPIHIFEAGTGKPVLSLLRPGKRPSGEEAAQVLRHVIAHIRRYWPRVEIMVRGDSHYAAPEVLDLLEEKRCGYILGLSTNARLAPMAQPWAEDAATRRALSKKEKEKVRRFHQATYQAKSWSKSRKIVARAEATAMGGDVRFVVTNLPGTARVLYEKVYCARGRMENMIKDMKLYTRSDRTSCHRWEANQFRLFLHMAAYWLLLSLRAAAPRRSLWRTATFETLRRAFLKIAVRVEELKSRIKVAFPSAYPHAPVLALLAGTITARSS
jgi:Transposase DDE domain group 1